MPTGSMRALLQDCFEAFFVEPWHDLRREIEMVASRSSHCLVCWKINPGYKGINNSTDIKLRSFEESDRSADLSALSASAAAGCAFCDFIRQCILHLCDLYGYDADRELDLTCTMGRLALNDVDETLNYKMRYRWGRTMIRISYEMNRTGKSGRLYFGILIQDKNIPDRESTNLISELPQPPPLSQHDVEFIEMCFKEFSGNPREVKRPLPSRVIDVGDECRSPRILASKGLLGFYVILSYCWGNLAGNSTFLTVRENVEERQRQLGSSALPRTLSDALRFTRSLGFQYLWIDALCIVQDDPDEWRIEAEQMSEYYANAHITIVPLSSHSVRDGFAARSRPRTHSMRFHYGKFDTCYYTFARKSLRTGFNRSIHESNWGTRGWTLQERCLSERILYVTAEKLFFEGSMRDRNLPVDVATLAPFDCYFEFSRHSWGIPLHSLRANLATLAYQGRLDMESVYRFWYDLIIDYRGRRLSVQSDALPAVSGIARVICTYCSDEYLAGLWRGDLARGLLWEPSGDTYPTQVEVYLGPSWSWCSFTGRVLFKISNIQRSLELNIIHAFCETVPDARFGRVYGGEIKAVGKVVDVLSLRKAANEAWCLLAQDSCGPEEQSTCHGYLRYLSMAEARLDMSESPEGGVVALLIETLGRTDGDKGVDDCLVQRGLILRKMPDEDENFRRIGTFTYPRRRDVGGNHSGPHTCNAVSPFLHAPASQLTIV